MGQPMFWTVLLGVAVLAAVARLVVGGPLLRSRAVPVGATALTIAGLSVAALVFHCTSMFFASWTDALPAGRPLGEAVRALGPASQWAYWVPAVLLVVSLRRIWWPGTALLTVTLAGVGATMFWPYPLATHLSWLAAAILSVVFVGSALVGPWWGSGRGAEPAQVSRQA